MPSPFESAVIRQMRKPCIVCGHLASVAIPTEFDSTGAIAWDNLCGECDRHLQNFRAARTARREARRLARDLALFLEAVTE